MNSKTRPTLLKRLRDAADPLAWEEFFARYWPLVYSFAKYRGCSDHTAEEIVQDVMLKVFEQRDVFQYDPERGRFRDWLSAVVRNQLAERRRRPSERIRARGDDSGALVLEPEVDDMAPDDPWEAAFEASLLVALLDTLRREMAARDYLAFELSTLAELPGARVAEITGISRNAVYKARRRALARLKTLSGSYADDGQLTREIQEALASQPDGRVERSLSTRIHDTMRSR